MLAHQKSISFLSASLIVSLLVSPSLAQPCEISNQTKTLAIAAAVIATTGAIWCFCQPEKSAETELQELCQKLTQDYATLLGIFAFDIDRFTKSYSCLKKTKKLANDIEQLEALIHRFVKTIPNFQRPYSMMDREVMSNQELLLEEAADLLAFLKGLHSWWVRDQRYLLDLKNEQLAQEQAWQRWCSTQLSSKSSQSDAVKVNNSQASDTHKTKTDKSVILETKSTSIFDYSHDAADL